MRTVPCATETICHVQMRTSSNFAEQSDTFVKLGLTQPFNFFPSKKRPFPVRNSIQRKTLKARCIKQPLFGDTAEKSTAPPLRDNRAANGCLARRSATPR